jgi:hypothetical protein
MPFPRASERCQWCIFSDGRDGCAYVGQASRLTSSAAASARKVRPNRTAPSRLGGFERARHSFDPPPEFPLVARLAGFLGLRRRVQIELPIDITIFIVLDVISWHRRSALPGQLEGFWCRGAGKYMDKSRVQAAIEQTRCLILTLALTIPFFISWLRLKGQSADLYEAGLGFSLFGAANIILFSVLAWINAPSPKPSLGQINDRRSPEIAGGFSASEKRFRSFVDAVED